MEDQDKKKEKPSEKIIPENISKAERNETANPNFFGELFRFALVTLLIVIPVRLYVAQPFIVNGSSMDPTFETGQYLIIDEIGYRFGDPIRGDVIVFNAPPDPKKFFIKRIIGLPGETIELKGDKIIVKNATNTEGFALDESYLKNNTGQYARASIALKNNEYFVMGDNRNASFDSRAWGPLKKDMIVGRAFLRLFPIENFAIIPGRAK